MERFTDIIALWADIKDFAEDAGITPLHARTLRSRDSIPSDYWLKLVTGAQARSIEGLSLERLARIAECRREAVA